MEASPRPGTPAQAREVIQGIARFWWLWLVFGIAWVAISVVILQFDQASITTVGVIIGLMFLGTSLQQFAIASMVDRMKWLYAIFGVLFLGAAIGTFISPENTFAALADLLGFLFLIVGIFWVIQAMATRDVNELWWLGLISGIAMIVIAFWVGGQFFIDKVYLLLIFAGIWALMHGIGDIGRAFVTRAMRNQL